MLPCRACGLMHPPMMLCGVAKRIAINNGAINGAINKSGGNIAGIEGSKRDGISQPEPDHQGDSNLLQRKNAGEAGKRRNSIDVRTTELLGTRVHPQMPEGKRAVSGQENSVAVSEVTPNRRSRSAYNGYMREFMRKKRSTERLLRTKPA